MQEVEIKKADLKVIDSIVQIHKDSFPDFFLTSLGSGFLYTYYSISLTLQDTILLYAESEIDGILGFAMGTKNASNYHRKLMIRGFLKFAYHLFLNFLRRPQAFLRLLKNLEKNDLSAIGSNYGELLSIAVSPKYEGIGIGRELISSFTNELVEKNVSKMVLTTDRFNNDGVVRFYTKLGFVDIEEFVAYPNRHMYRMIKTLHNNGEARI